MNDSTCMLGAGALLRLRERGKKCLTVPRLLLLLLLLLLLRLLQ
jgi:hypothetical protein